MALQPSSRSWVPVPCENPSAAPCHRSLHVCAVRKDSLYIFGGYDGSNRINDFYEFNFKRKLWSVVLAIGSAPSPRDRHVAVVYKDSFYVFAGFDGSSRVNDFIEYNFLTQRWSNVVVNAGLPPTARHSHAAVVYGRLPAHCNSFCKRDLTNLRGEIITLAATSVQIIRCTVLEDTMAAIGTIFMNSTLLAILFNTPYLLQYSETSTWSLVASTGRVPRPRYRSSLVVHNRTCVLFGGHDGSRHLNDVHVYDFDTRVWSLLPTEGPAPIARDSHVAVINSNSMYIFGGSTGTAVNDFYELSFETNTWQSMQFNGQPPGQRFCHVGTVYDSSLIIFGGYDGSSRLNDFKQFRFGEEEFQLEIPESTLISDLRMLVNNDIMSDVTFIVEGVPVYGHKILCIRCNYFNAMLTGEMLESRAREIQITDVRRPIFISLMEYLYTDYLDVAVDVAMELFVTADRYGVERLKRICESKMLGSLCIENAASIFHAADLHNAIVLRDQCVTFMLHNFDAVTKTDAFEEMGRTNVELVFELLKRR
ncbi:Leucine-zipper-like transcriptional regulator 1 [Phytophthora citrophthora]|uniref:Leucine-zipper-like transcriptional regulator 1 n=1 Tax=Phytophthora citrophthora TaxID=4793 RepID=A0AAD9LU97_9STRA|nr:Leucine-zipper-like transcriptional regulator 1 [Phytophthora citrophthora]